MQANPTIQPPLGTHPTQARGEVFIPLGGSEYPVRFSLAVLNDYTRATGKSLADLGTAMADDLLGTIGQLLTAAVRRYVPGAQLPANFALADGLDVMEALSPEQADKIAAAIWVAIRIDQNPLLAALIAQAPQPSVPNENGASTSTLPSAN